LINSLTGNIINLFYAYHTLGLLDAVNLLISLEQLAQAAPIPNPPPRMIGQRRPTNGIQILKLSKTQHKNKLVL
jgi:hypothetical protein